MRHLKEAVLVHITELCCKQTRSGWWKLKPETSRCCRCRCRASINPCFHQHLQCRLHREHGCIDVLFSLALYLPRSRCRWSSPSHSPKLQKAVELQILVQIVLIDVADRRCCIVCSNSSVKYNIDPSTDRAKLPGKESSICLRLAVLEKQLMDLYTLLFLVSSPLLNGKKTPQCKL